MAPPAASFSAGDLYWDLSLFRTAPELQSFRDTFAGCAGKTGIEAARCITDFIKAKSPRGDPNVEFVDAEFDPATVLREHLDGAPGHCTARSFMTTTGLLSLGVPARIVQVLPLRAGGHNLVEVWDPAYGWVLFDPFFDSSYLLGDSFLSSVELSRVRGGLRWRRPAANQLDPNDFAGGTIHYPEPWLYTRIGSRCAPWPFRGCFAQVGPRQFLYGPAQRLAVGAVIFFGLASGFGALRLVLTLRRRLVAVNLSGNEGHS